MLKILIKDKPLNINQEEFIKYIKERGLTIKKEQIKDVKRIVNLIIIKIREDLKFAREFYLKYKNNPKLLIKDHPDLLNMSPRITQLMFDIDDLYTKYSVNTHFLGRMIVESLGFERDVNKLHNKINKKIKELFKLIKEELDINFSNIDEYNEWLFNLTYNYK